MHLTALRRLRSSAGIGFCTSLHLRSEAPGLSRQGHPSIGCVGLWAFESSLPVSRGGGQGAASEIPALVDLVIGSNRAGGNRAEGAAAGFQGVDDSRTRSAILQTKAASAESRDTAMRYWLLLSGKLCAVVLASWLLWAVVVRYSPHAPGVAPLVALTYLLWKLPWTLTIGVVFVAFCAGLYLCVLDQLYRCRVCCRRLRMPVTNGSRSHALTDRPHTDYICTYGHGKLSVPEAQLSGFESYRWTFYGDIWKELFGDQTVERTG